MTRRYSRSAFCLLLFLGAATLMVRAQGSVSGSPAPDESHIGPHVTDEPPMESSGTDALHMGHLATPFDTIPDFAQSPTVFTVKNGSWTDPTLWSTGVLPGAADIVSVRHNVQFNSTTAVVKTLAIESGASWSCALTQSTALRVGTLLASPGSTLKCGTAAAPLQAPFTADIIIRDLPLQTTDPSGASGVYDPRQYGTGVLAIDATVHLHGAPISPTFIRLAAEPLAGSRTLTLSAAPTGWRVGDKVVIPDTRQLAAADYAPRPNGDFDNVRRKVSYSETATIQSLSGTTVTLATTLAYDHKGARDPDGVLRILPHVGNLSRTVTIRSENPAGTRGHVLLTRAVDADIRYVGFRNLGRTTAAALDSTTFDTSGNVTRVGTNQIGRYPLHIHHVPGVCPAGSYQFTLRGNAIDDGRKWAMTVHGSHYGLIQDNVIFDAQGAGIATEDGSETENVFDHNFIVRSESAASLQSDETDTDPFGRKGNGFWFRGPNNIVRNNVVADAREGYGYYAGSAETGPNSALVSVRLPLFRCADASVTGEYTTVQLLRVYNREVTNNEAYSTSSFGFGTWFLEQPTTARIPFKDTTLWHAARVAVFHKYWNGTFDGLVILNEGGGGVGIQQFNNNVTGQAMRSELYRGNIQGVDIAYRKSGQLALAPSWVFQDSTFRTRSGIVLDAMGQNNQSSNSASSFVFRNVRFVAMPGLPLASLTLSTTGGDPSNYGKSFMVYDYQGNPNDNFRVYYTSQAPNAPAPTLGTPGGGCPAGLTNQQCWDASKMAMFQALAACSTTRPEINGFVCAITPPRAPTAVVVK